MATVVLPAGPGAFAVTGASAGLTTPRVLVAAPGSFAITGGAATLSATKHLLIAPGAFALTGAPATPVLSVDPITVLENAIHAWVVAGAGLGAQQVIWGGRGPAPAGVYIELWLRGIERVSQDWVIPRREGTGVVTHVRGTRSPTLELTCFAGDRFGAARPEAILDRVLTAIRLPTVRAGLRAAGVGIGQRGNIRVIEMRRSTLFDPRATVEVGLHTVIDVSELGAEVRTVGVQTATEAGTRSGSVAKP